MVIAVECLNVIVPKSAIDSKYPGGLPAYRGDCPNQTFREDEHLTRVGFMGPWDVQAFVDKLIRLGFVYLDEHQQARDIAVVDMMAGPTTTCAWLEFDAGELGPRCWLRTTPTHEMSRTHRPGDEEFETEMASTADRGPKTLCYATAIAALNAALGRAGGGDSVLLLKEAQEVVNAATEIGIGKLLEQLHHPYWVVRSMACETIGDQNYMPACSQLALLLKDENDVVRSRAREAIEEIHSCRLSDEDCDQLFRSVADPGAPLEKYPREPRVFISYTRRNSDFARWLTQELKAARVRFWLDEVEIANDEASEAQLIHAIAPGVRGSDYLALVLSSAVKDSWWVEREIRIARLFQHVRNPVTILALAIDGTDIPDVLKHYSPLVRLDFTDSQAYGTAFMTLVKKISPADRVNRGGSR